MKVIVGLGNPGQQYADTPHSVGFEVVDLIAAGIGAVWEAKKSFKCLWARGMLSGVPVLLIKPQTYMNLSGDSVAPIVKYNNATTDDLLVIQDDIDLPAGRLRIRKGGSCGGHNGIRNIIERLGTQEFTRIKIGVGKERGNVIGHVLGKFDPNTREMIDKVLAEAVNAIAMIAKDGPDKAMNCFNSFKVEQ